MKHWNQNQYLSLALLGFGLYLLFTSFNDAGDSQIEQLITNKANRPTYISRLQKNKQNTKSITAKKYIPKTASKKKLSQKDYEELKKLAKKFQKKNKKITKKKKKKKKQLAKTKKNLNSPIQAERKPTFDEGVEEFPANNPHVASGLYKKYDDQVNNDINTDPTANGDQNLTWLEIIKTENGGADEFLAAYLAGQVSAPEFYSVIDSLLKESEYLQEKAVFLLKMSPSDTSFEKLALVTSTRYYSQHISSLANTGLNDVYVGMVYLSILDKSITNSTEQVSAQALLLIDRSARANSNTLYKRKPSSSAFQRILNTINLFLQKEGISNRQRVLANKAKQSILGSLTKQRKTAQNNVYPY